MQLKYVPASRLLVQPVDILRDECRQFARLLHLRQTPMDDIGLGLRINHVFTIKIIENIRMQKEKRMAEQHFSRQPIIFAGI